MFAYSYVAEPTLDHYFPRRKRQEQIKRRGQTWRGFAGKCEAASMGCCQFLLEKLKLNRAASQGLQRYALSAGETVAANAHQVYPPRCKECSGRGKITRARSSPTVRMIERRSERTGGRVLGKVTVYRYHFLSPTFVGRSLSRRRALVLRSQTWRRWPEII
jgi:hypothetical protein